MEVITTHLNADFDALASMIAAKKLYPDATLVFPGSQEKNIRNFFLNSTAYAFGFQKLKNIDLEKIHRLILVDTRQKSRIGPFEKIIGKEGLSIHIYDHHPASNDDIRGEKEVIKLYGATTTILSFIIKDKGLTLSPDEATIMILGIYEDTGGFTFASTRPEDFMAAAFLLSSGADLKLISDFTAPELTTEEISILNQLIESSQVLNINGIELVLTKISTKGYIGEFAMIVNKYIELENIDVVLALAQMEDRVFIVGRSRLPEVDVGRVLSELGGGGHPYAASATLKNYTLAQAERRLISVLQKSINRQLTAKDLMSSPAIVISHLASINKAKELLDRYSINVLPVVTDGKILGTISRQIVEKAIFHKLGNLPVSDYMMSEISTVTPDTSLWDIQRLLLKHNQRVLPVVQDQKIVGIISRTDLLNVLVDNPGIPDYLYGEKPFVRYRKVKNLLKEILPAHIYETLKEMGEVAAQLGFNIYVVGGFVRDLLLRKPNLDIDLVVEGDGPEFVRAYKKVRDVKVRIHEKFATAVVIFPDGLKIDVATARLEYYQAPGALPIVEVSSLKLDLYRRDFTINTLAIKLNPKHFGQLIDYFGAQRDIKDRVIRVLHNLSFVEDPTRIFRAVRFSERFNFRIGKVTHNLIKNAVKIRVVERLSGKRILNELKLIFLEPEPENILRRLEDYRVIEQIHPSIRFDSSQEGLFKEVGKVLAWYKLLYLNEPMEPWRVYFVAFLRPVDQNEIEEVIDRFEINVKDLKALLISAKTSHVVLQKLRENKNILPSELYRLLKPLKTEILLYMMALDKDEEIKRKISLYISKLRYIKPALTGNNLKEMGFTPGPIFSEILKAVLDAKLDGKLLHIEDERRFVMENYMKNH